MAVLTKLFVRGVENFLSDGRLGSHMNILMQFKSPIFQVGYAKTKVAKYPFMT